MVVVTNAPEQQQPHPQIETPEWSLAPTSNHAARNNKRPIRWDAPTTLNHCKELVQIAIRDKEAALLKGCYIFLESKMCRENVLEIYAFLGELRPSDPYGSVPSAPPMPENEDSNWDAYLAQVIACIRKKCNLKIDAGAQEIFLFHDQVAKLSYHDLHAILTRDKLNIQNEEILYKAILEWGKRKCTGREELRQCLGDLPKAPRYGLMTWKSFKKLKGIRDLLEDKDYRTIRFYLEEKSKGREAHGLPYLWSKPRDHPASCTKVQRKESSTFERFGFQCLLCWVMVFD